MAVSIENSQLTFEQLAREQQILRRMGVGESTPQYYVAGFKLWIETYFSSKNEQNATVQKVLEICMSIAGDFLANKPRKNGPLSTKNRNLVDSSEKTYLAHGYRCVRIIADEFGITDPMVLATTFLHDAYEKLSSEEIDLFEESIHKQFSRVVDPSFAAQLLLNLQHFYQLDQRYSQLAKKVQQDLQYQGYFATGIDTGFTPEPYQQLITMILDKYSGSPIKKADEQYFTVAELVDYTNNGFGEKKVGDQVGGLATMLAMMAQAIDNSRYPRHPESLLQDALLARMRDALDVIYNLIPLARSLNAQPAVRLLSESVAAAFFPEQWAALNEALTHISKQRKRKGNGQNFDTQLRANTWALRKEIKRRLAEAGFEAKEVSVIELEKRMVRALSQDSEIVQIPLDPDEYAIYIDKKTPGSIIAKWLGDCAKGKLNDPRWCDTCGAGEEQRVIAEKFKDPKIWEEYLFGATDILRSTVVLGSELAKKVGLPETELGYEKTLIAQGTGLVYPEDGDILPQAIINYYKTNRNAKDREEAEGCRISPMIEDDQLLFEWHLVLQLVQFSERQHIQNLPFELHVESVSQWLENNFGTQLHLFMKMGAKGLPLEKKKEIAAKFRDIMRKFYGVVYNGTIEVMTKD